MATLEEELIRSTEEFIRICREQGPFYALAYIYDLEYDRERLRQMMRILRERGMHRLKEPSLKGYPFRKQWLLEQIRDRGQVDALQQGLINHYHETTGCDLFEERCPQLEFDLAQMHREGLLDRHVSHAQGPKGDTFWVYVYNLKGE